MEGYIKQYRNVLENPVCCKDKDYFCIWNTLLLLATHTEQKVLFGGKVITLLPGQLITGRKRLSDKWNISESKVERILKAFKTEQQIEQQTCSKNRLITILNWDKYQNSEQQDEQQVNNNRTTTEQQVNTNKNDKNERMKEIIYIYNSTCVSFPRVRSLSALRQKAISARLNTYTIDDFKTLFQKAEQSNFLKGKNNRNWIATFDWLIKDNNFAKVIEGNYDNRKNTVDRSFKESSIDSDRLKAKINNFD